MKLASVPLIWALLFCCSVAVAFSSDTSEVASISPSSRVNLEGGDDADGIDDNLTNLINVELKSLIRKSSLLHDALAEERQHRDDPLALDSSYADHFNKTMELLLLNATAMTLSLLQFMSTTPSTSKADTLQVLQVRVQPSIDITNAIDSINVS